MERPFPGRSILHYESHGLIVHVERLISQYKRQSQRLTGNQQQISFHSVQRRRRLH